MPAEGRVCSLTRGDMRGAGALRSSPPNPRPTGLALFSIASLTMHTAATRKHLRVCLFFFILWVAWAAPHPFFVSHFRAGGVRPKHRPAPRRSTRAGLRLHSWPGTPTRRTKGAPSSLQAPLVSLSSVFFRACITTFSNQSTLHCIWALLRTLRDLDFASHPCFATLCRDRALSFCPMKWRLFLAM